MTPSSIDVEVLVDPPLQSQVSTERLVEAARLTAETCGFCSAEIAIRVTGDAEIRSINRRHLQHDYATDVISFGYLAEPPRLEGELVISRETAERIAAELEDWDVDQELTLYVVHGVLHLCGMDDANARERAEMRRAEQELLLRLGCTGIRRWGADCLLSGETASQSDDFLQGDQE